MAQAECTFNLQQLGFGLNHYRALHGSYPYVSPASPAAHAGTYAVLLDQEKVLPTLANLDCPGNGPSALKSPLPRLADLCRGEKGAHKCPPCMQHLDYAYAIGYEHKPGQFGPASAGLQAANALLADKPAHADGRILDGNSPNHGGDGQNVLFGDGHVSWHTTRRLGPLDDDMFLNQSRHAAPGLNASDIVLAPGDFRFDGGR